MIVNLCVVMYSISISIRLYVESAGLALKKSVEANILAVGWIFFF